MATSILKNKWFLVTTIIFLVLISYGQTLQMYFWQDDSALIFKLQHPEGPAGSWGNGLWERGPYRYAVALFLPFFKFFGMEPFGYFTIGWILYLIATGIFYVFARQLLQNRKGAYLSALVFAGGFIGSDSMFRVANSWHNNIGVIFTLLTLWSYTRFLRSGKLRDYLLSVGIFWVTIELIFIRSHSLIFPILGLDFLFRFFPPHIRKIPGLIVRQLPFWILFKLWYLQEANASSIGVGEFVRDVFIKKEFIKIASLTADVGNGLIPDIIQTRIIAFLTQLLQLRQGLNFQIFEIHLLALLSVIFIIFFLGRSFRTSIRLKALIILLAVLVTVVNLSFSGQNVLWYRDIQTVIAGLIGLYAWVVIPFVSIVIWRTRQNIAIAILFGLVILTSQIFGYYIKYPEAVFSSTHRYFTYSFIGYSLLFGSLFYLLAESFRNRWKLKGVTELVTLTPLFLFVGINLFLGFSYQDRIVRERSIPSREFYQDLIKVVPRVDKGAIFYFDVADDGFYKRQFNDFFSVGSMPNSTALAIYYGLDRDDIILVENFDELVFKISDNDWSLDEIYTFYYGEKGLINTTDKTRLLLKNGSGSVQVGQRGLEFETKQAVSREGVVTEPLKIPLSTQEINTLTPLLLELELRISPLRFPNSFPFLNQGEVDKNLSLNGKLRFLSCLSEIESYYQSVKVNSLSDWKYREVRNVVDKNTETVWQGGRIYWHDYKKEQLTVDLGVIKPISSVIWQNWRLELTPVSYTVQTSLNGSIWDEVKTIEDGPERKGGDLVTETFTPHSARFVRVSVRETLGDDSPAMEEFLVVGPECLGVDLKSAKYFLENPFGYVRDRKEWEEIYKGLTDIAKMKIEWSSDQVKDQVRSTDFPVKLDNQIHTYQVTLPAEGGVLTKMDIALNLPARVYVQEVKVRNLSIGEMRSLGLIKNF